MTFTTKIWSLWIGSNPWEFSWISHRFLKSINKHLIIFCCNVFVWKSGLGEMIAPGSDIIMNPPLIKHAAKYTSSKLSKCELCRIQFILISRVYYLKTSVLLNLYLLNHVPRNQFYLIQPASLMREKALQQCDQISI